MIPSCRLVQEQIYYNIWWLQWLVRNHPVTPYLIMDSSQYRLESCLTYLHIGWLADCVTCQSASPPILSLPVTYHSIPHNSPHNSFYVNGSVTRGDTDTITQHNLPFSLLLIFVVSTEVCPMMDLRSTIPGRASSRCRAPHRGTAPCRRPPPCFLCPQHTASSVTPYRCFSMNLIQNFFFPLFTYLSGGPMSR